LRKTEPVDREVASFEHEQVELNTHLTKRNTTPSGSRPWGPSNHRPLPRRVLPGILLCAGLFLSASLLRPPPGSAEAWDDPCTVLDREKWIWHSWFEDFLPPFFDSPIPPDSDASFSTCWACGLWAGETWPPSWNPPPLQEAVTFREANCARSLDMQQAALAGYQAVLREAPTGERAPGCIGAVVEILVGDGNLEPALSFYDGLAPAQQAMAAPETLFLLGHSCYVLGQDQRASAFLNRVPAGSGADALARYTRVQIAFRNGDPDRAAADLQELARSGPDGAVPAALREQAQLTLARILFQQAHYERAADAFRSLGHSRYFLPEALLGMGWCYEAMDRPAQAIAFFQAADEAASGDVLLQSKARMETAGLYAESGMHEEAFQAFRQTQERMRAYLAFLSRLAQAPDRLEAQARRLLPQASVPGPAPEPEAAPVEPPAGRAFAPAPGAPSEPGDFQAEIDAVVSKAGYVSPRMQQLNGIRDALVQIQTLLDRSRDASPPPAMRRGIPTRPTPALDSREDMLPPETVRLLDAALALLDAEYRLTRTTGLLALTSPQERREAFQESLGAYRSVLQALVTESTADAPRDPAAALGKLMVLVRYRSAPLEDRERILKKLVHTQQALSDIERTLQRWAQGMADAGAGDPIPPRPLLLRFWMVYVRSLVALRTWHERSPAVFLLPEIESGRADVPGRHGNQDGGRDLLDDRMTVCRKRLETAVQEEIRRVCTRRLANLENLLLDSELYYAEALLKQQNSLLRELQSLPQGDKEGDGPEERPEEAPPTPADPGRGT